VTRIHHHSRAALDSTQTEGLAHLGVEESLTVRAPYAYDASNYRVMPDGVAFPGDVTDVRRIVRSCSEAGVPIVCRGAGTSMAGNAIGGGVILDFSRHMNRVLSVDVESRTAVVEPGVVLDALQSVLRPHGLMFAPDPSSHSRATIGGMVGNDACGNHSVKYGRTSRHVVALDLVLPDGTLVVADSHGIRPADPDDELSTARAAQLEDSLRSIVDDSLAPIRTELGQIPRQVSGYQLQHLLPENGFNVARAMVGTEGTCAVVVGVTVSLVQVPPAALLVALGYDTIVDAARDIPEILRSDPAAVEGIDETIVATMRARRGDRSVTGLPDGRAWLFVDIEGDDADAVTRAASDLVERLATSGHTVDGRVVRDRSERAALWRVREDGAGLVARRPDGTQTWAGWEDSAVAPHVLADYLHELRQLLDAHRLTGVFYGHLGAGCVHIRIDFDLTTAAGAEAMKTFSRAATQLVAKHGGSISGEHGDGRARSELLELIYSSTLIAAFGRMKAAFDPQGVLNPGVIVAPAALEADLAPTLSSQRSVMKTVFRFADDPDGFTGAVGRCVGVSRCRSESDGAMCPSFKATREEKDSTRGRARALQEMLRGFPVSDGWRSTEVLDTLDLCLSCKACASDCPVGVDMATYKSEFLHHHYRGRLRPASHYSLGWLPVVIRIAGWAPWLVNRLLRSQSVTRVLTRIGGITPHRRLPHIHSRHASRRGLTDDAAVQGADALLFTDTFTRAFRPPLVAAAQRVLADAGTRTHAVEGLCCGLTWISTGQLTIARRVLQRTVERLAHLAGDRAIVVLEPSCAATLVKDAPELLGSSEAHAVAQQVRTFAGLVEDRIEAGWMPPTIASSASLQTHCHETAVFGSDSQRRVLSRLGVHDLSEAEGCCGLAGNFGFERNHYDVSMRVAELSLAPLLKDTPADRPVVADGFSCQTQITHLRDGLAPAAKHLAELLDEGMQAGRPATRLVPAPRSQS
jgi:FAD/FMN-containing dehydrogenase/Fe-S oxidoreductase